MNLIVVGFISVLLISFVLVMAITRRSPLEKQVNQRLVSIQRTNSKSAEDVTSDQLLKDQKVSRLGWLEAGLRRFSFARNLQLRIIQANSSATVSGLVLCSLGLAGVGYAVTWFLAPLLVLDIGVAAILAWVPFAFIGFKRTRRINAFDAVLAESIDMLSRALRAGYSMVGAIEMLAANAQKPAGPEFGEVFKQQNLGMPMRDALMQLLERVPSQDLRVLVTGILVQRESGGNLAEILDRIVFVIRERQRIQGEIRVQTAQGRLTGWILSALPVVMLVMINLINPGYSRILLHDPTGRKMIYVSVGMLATGAFLIRRIVNGIEV